MKTIFLILIFLIFGLLFGFIFARLMYSISNYFLKRKITKEALTDERKFFYKEKPYNLKEQIEYERSKRKKFSLFKKKVKGGISEYGNTTDAGNIGKQIPDSDNGSPASNPSPAISPATSPGEQIRLDSPENRGERRNFNRNLFEKGK